MDREQIFNSFSSPESHRDVLYWICRALTVLTWLFVLVVTLTCSFDALALGRATSIWAQNSAHPTPFSLNPIITSIYWFTLLAFQAGYLYSLFRPNTETVDTAADVGPHFVVNNILQALFFGLWVDSRFWSAEIIVVLNMLNVNSLYFRHPRTPQYIHGPIVTGPLAFNFITIFWNGAAMVNSTTLTARVIANIAIWFILLYGMFFLVAFNDYWMGWELSILAASLAIHQLRIRLMSIHWIFAFVVMSLLITFSLGSTALNLLGKELRFVGETDSARSSSIEDDAERAPLLEEN